MSATLIGSVKNANSKQLRKVVSNVEIDGLVLITESYTIRRADEDYFRVATARGTTHKGFSSNNIQYTRMKIETSRIDPLDGDYSSLVVNYAGLTTASGLPPAYVTAIGQIGAGVFGSDTAIVAKYLSSASIYSIVQGGTIALNLNSSNLAIPSKRIMPASINGTPLPANPRPREYRRTKTTGEQLADQIAWRADYMSKNASSTNGVYFFGPPILNYAPQVEWLYAGYVQSSVTIDQRGAFLQIEEQFTEYFSGSDQFYTSNGVPNINLILQFGPVVQSF
jgi:hypothetical protein